MRGCMGRGLLEANNNSSRRNCNYKPHYPSPRLQVASFLLSYRPPLFTVKFVLECFVSFLFFPFLHPPSPYVCCFPFFPRPVNPPPPPPPPLPKTPPLSIAPSLLSVLYGPPLPVAVGGASTPVIAVGALVATGAVQEWVVLVADKRPRYHTALMVAGAVQEWVVLVVDKRPRYHIALMVVGAVQEWVVLVVDKRPRYHIALMVVGAVQGWVVLVVETPETAAASPRARWWGWLPRERRGKRWWGRRSPR